MWKYECNACSPSTISPILLFLFTASFFLSYFDRIGDRADDNDFLDDENDDVDDGDDGDEDENENDDDDLACLSHEYEGP